MTFRKTITLGLAGLLASGGVAAAEPGTITVKRLSLRSP